MAFTVSLLQRTRLAPGVFELAFSRPQGLSFRPGQHLRFCRNRLERDYTPVSLDQDNTLRICVRQGRNPGFSGILTGCDPGSVFEVSGPHGHFVFSNPAPSAPPVVFIATGTGIAPFVAFARAGAKGDTLLQGAGTPEELIYKDTVSRNNRTYVPCISREASAGPEGVFRGRVTDYLKHRLPRGKYLFYLCGRRQMILDAVDIIDEKFPDSRVFAERFS